MSDGPVTYSRFPAAVTSPRRRERKAAVIVRGGVAEIAVLVRGEGVKVVETFDVADVATVNRRTTLIEPDGTTWTIDRGDGCSCSSPLKSWYVDALGVPARAGS